MTKQPKPKGFVPGATYKRPDGTLMVEVKPGKYVNVETARGMGVVPRKVGEGRT